MVRSCRTASHRQLKEKARGRVGELQSIFADLQLARKESRATDVVLLEEYVHRMLGEWKAELSDASPASSLLGNCCVSPNLSSEVQRMLQLYEEEDDATSNLAELQQLPNPKFEIGDEQEQKEECIQKGGIVTPQEFCNATKVFPEPEILVCDQYKGTAIQGLQLNALNCMDVTTDFGSQQFSLHQGLPHNTFLYLSTGQQTELDVIPPISELSPALRPVSSSLLKPKCALWDCPRPAQGLDWYLEYCSSFHATLAFNEGPPGMTPVLRPGGIYLKDGPLFTALLAKTQGKNVGIPECQGAATAKSPWNAPELFDLIVLKGESLREWLFFDKPRRAFESGNRKQRSLPDYNGRGWHESRKQVVKEFGGLKRSYYMDPQPLCQYEWHLYEYEINSNDSCSLFRLELKLVDAKRAKSKVCNDSLTDLQWQMRMLKAENTIDNKRHVNSRTNVDSNEIDDYVCQASDIIYTEENVQKASETFQLMASMNDNFVYGPDMSVGYSVENSNNFYGT